MALQLAPSLRHKTRKNTLAMTTETFGQRLLGYFVGPTFSEVSAASSKLSDTASDLAATSAGLLDTLSHTQHAVDTTAQQLRDAFANPGRGLSSQPTIPRGQFTQKVAAFYYDVFPGNHVLVVYDRAPRLMSARRVLAGDGRVVAGPTEMWTVHKKVHRGKGQFGLWGFHVWVFGEGEFELLGDGGWVSPFFPPPLLLFCCFPLVLVADPWVCERFVNWCFKSGNFKRDGKRVSFFKMDGHPSTEGSVAVQPP